MKAIDKDSILRKYLSLIHSATKLGFCSARVMKRHDMKMSRSAAFSHFFRSKKLCEEELASKFPVQFLHHSAIGSIAITRRKKKGQRGQQGMQEGRN